MLREYAAQFGMCFWTEGWKVSGHCACSDEIWRKDAKGVLGNLEGLNRSQQRAIATAMSSTFTLWQVRPHCLIFTSFSSQGPISPDKRIFIFILQPHFTHLSGTSFCSRSRTHMHFRPEKTMPAPAWLSKTEHGATQGPPGTGKTRTLLALLEVLARIAPGPGRANAMGPILACADTNAATDNIVEGLLARGINVTRMGQPAKVGAALSLRSYHTRFVCNHSAATGPLHQGAARPFLHSECDDLRP